LDESEKSSLRAKRSNPEAVKQTGLLRRLRLLAMTGLIELEFIPLYAA
jgi:hypothetical protein